MNANVQVGDWGLENVYNYVTPLELEEKKFDYFFGMVDSNKHNLDRSLQNQNQLNSIGIFNNEYGRKILKDSIYKQLQNPNNIIDRRISNYNGKSQIFETREMLIVGPNGVKIMVVDFEVMNNHSRRVTTIIIKGGK